MFVEPFEKPFSFPFVGDPFETIWYMAGGAPAPISFWDAVNAASLAASKVNLINPGTYDLTGAGATPPTWSTAGWEGTGTGYLQTGIVPALSYTFAFRVTGVDNTFEGIAGCIGSSKNFYTRNTGENNVNIGIGAGGDYLAAYNTNMRIIFTNGLCSINGVQTALTVGAGNPTTEIYLLAYNSSGASAAFPMDAGDRMLEALVWDQSLTSSQMTAIDAAWAAL